ncbi:TPA: dimethylsulfoxide reductase subunit B [Shigella sonnei]|nr:dimethylsulfoxide reductase subunit B [Escherichia coli]EFP8328368.1 dimethylsulfoxide reductase subunit B [Shigella sonnei]EFV5751698.1 dimethylsulfoxide reductase subunit B [Shigella sonnei]EFV5755757.1 dimethylsulfoxide reductase subunit B [Shigella sonnei]EFV5816433.1 dimethylsulfoxide reductase subunit B [Shigella sonnei]
MTTQYGFFIDSSRCTGCKTCELACKDFKDLGPEVSFRRIYEYAGGDWQEDNGVWHQNVFAYYLSISCNHCDDPACTKVCPSGAMHKREDGFVVVDEDVCIGCRYCHMACPYGAPQYNAEKGHMTKCDGCYSRVAEGKQPICVESCPLRALEFGPIEELRQKHGTLAAVAPLPRAHFTKPNIVIKPNANSRPTSDTTGYLANPEEVKMGNGWHEWPLVIFTVLGQCVVGALIVSGIGWFAAKNDADRQRIVRGMFFLWLLMGIGFMASVMHLGSPLRAFNSLNRIGASGLSNEIAAGSIFFAVGGLWWLVAVIGKMPQALGKLWLLVSMALGVIFVWMMTCVYQIDTVPTWHNGYTTLAFFLTVLLSGPILAAAILRAARVTFNTTPFAIISVLALIACAGVIVLQGLSLASIHSSVQQASALVPDYASLQVWRVVLLCAGLGCWLCPLIRRREPHVAGLVLGLILILVGEMIGRVLFYGLHMTVGMAIAG